MSPPEYRWFRATKSADEWTVVPMPAAPDIVLSLTSDVSSSLDQAAPTELAIQKAISLSTHPADYMICRIDGRRPDRVEGWYKR